MTTFLAPSLRKSTYGLWVSYVFGRPYSSMMVMTLVLPLMYNAVEVIAFVLLWLQARRGLAHDISPQTMVALSVSPMIDVLRKMRWYFMSYDDCQLNLEVACGTLAWWLFAIAPAVVTASALVCTWEVMKSDGANGDDDLIDPQRPRWMRWSTPYVSAFVVSLLLSVAVTYLTGEDVIFSRDDAFIATCQNFLHCFALLPQLVLCRRRGFVSPAAVKFLLIIGIKHIMEASIDFWSSSFMARKGSSHSDSSYLLGDLLASIVLLDFMYLWSVQTCKVGVRKSMKSCITLADELV